MECPRRITWTRIIPFLLAIPVVLAYANAFHAPFIFDDTTRLVRHGPLRDVWGCLVGSSRPVTMLSFVLNAALTGVRPEAFRLVNLVLHMGCGWLLYGLVSRVLERMCPPGGSADRRAWAAAGAALLWLVHPLQTESVTYVVQRAEVLMAFFYLLMLYSLARAAERANGQRWLTLSAAACALGMGSKAVMVTAPVMALLFDRAFYAGALRACLRRRGAYYALLAATWIVPAALLSVPHDSSSSAGPGSGVATPLGYLATQQGVILHYLRLIVWPDILCLDYGWPAAQGWGRVVLPAVCIGAGVALGAWGTWRRRPWGYPLFWFFVVLAPSSTLIPIADFAAERRVYLALAGLSALVVWPVVVRATRPAAVRLWAVCLVLAAGGLTVRTHYRNRDYGSRERMYRTILAARPNHLRAGVGLVSDLLEARRIPEAEAVARRMVARAEAGLRTGGGAHETSATSATFFAPILRKLLGRTLLLQGRYDEARDQLDMALEDLPADAAVWNVRALTFHAMGRREAAREAVRRALDNDPRLTDALGLYAYMLAEDCRWKEAAKQYRRLLRVDPEHAFGRLELAWLLATAPDPAVRDGAAAVRLAEAVSRAAGGYSAAAWDVLGAAHAESGDYAGALACVRRAMLAPTAGDTAGAEADRPGSAEGLAHRAALYTSGRPFRQETPPR
jgi:protein O-mannosyl-transferase